ncbi:MAG: glycosyltransferase family 2 protein [Deltaproteobacteria bacterium]|nr:glycosyltransferase family 2 protein [Deltaproteobacteria bacterium]MBK8236692.1 glycosyltransferase family 2 protein [Deltaproteobacteria bacterium]MBP7288733.1 glycosyltransferase family 2 protein [Nannocystaceae bacterium]
MRNLPSWVLVTPVHDEGELLEELASTIRAQELRPRRWVIVDDDSRDDTAALLERLAARDRWIDVIRLQRRGTTGAARYAEVLAQGFRAAIELAEAEGERIDFVANIDADVRPPPQLFAELVHRCAGDRTVGIASCRLGIVHDDGSFAPQLDHPCGAPRSGLRLWRRECLDQAAFYPTPHWGSVTGLRARNRGWRAVVYDDLRAELVRGDGSRRGWWDGWRRIGEGAWFVGAHPLSIAMQAVVVSAKERDLKGVALLAGYLESALRRRRRSNDPELLEFYGDALPRRQLSAAVAKLARPLHRRGGP